MVRSGSLEPCTRLSPAWLTGTMNGSGELMTKRRMPSAMRRSVFSASGFLRSKIDGHGRVPVDALGGGAVGLEAGPCVGSGFTMGRPSRRATMNRRSRVVGAP
jgi:hypothetical protein